MTKIATLKCLQHALKGGTKIIHTHREKKVFLQFRVILAWERRRAVISPQCSQLWQVLGLRSENDVNAANSALAIKPHQQQVNAVASVN